MLQIYNLYVSTHSTYDHRTLKTRLPVRSALFKQRTGGLVVRWVTTSEYPLLYVFFVGRTVFLIDSIRWKRLVGQRGRGPLHLPDDYAGNRRTIFLTHRSHNHNKEIDVKSLCTFITDI